MSVERILTAIALGYPVGMRSKNPSAIDLPALKEDLLSVIGRSDWSKPEKVMVRSFISKLDQDDKARIVHLYFALVRELGAATGQSEAMVFTEGGRLINWVDPHAYDSVPDGEVLDPVEFVQRRQGNAAAMKRLGGWIVDLPRQLDVLHAQIVKTTSTRVADFASALLELVRMVPKSGEIPPAIRELCQAIRLGKTSITVINPPGLIAFHWPFSQEDFGELLTAKEAVAFLERLGKSTSIRKLSDRAVERPSLKQADKYAREELRKAALEGFFDHRGKKSQRFSATCRPPLGKPGSGRLARPRPASDHA